MQYFPYIDLFVAAHHNIKTDRHKSIFQKALTALNKHEHCTFQNQNSERVFSHHCISEGNRLSSEHFGCHFHFILHVTSISPALSTSCWQRMNLHIYEATNRVQVCGKHCDVMLNFSKSVLKKKYTWMA